MNYYILFCQTIKTEKICKMLNGKTNIEAFIPKMETYIHTCQKIDRKVMFPGYLFVKTNYDQSEFNSLILGLHEEKNGLIKEIKKSDVSALTKEEIRLLSTLLDKDGILKMSVGYKDNGKTIVTEGPLVYFQDNIIDTDKRDMIAVLSVKFLNRNIKAGLLFKQNN